MLIAPELIGAAKTATLLHFLEWALTDGNQIARELGYEPLPEPLAPRLLDDAAAPACAGARDRSSAPDGALTSRATGP